MPADAPNPTDDPLPEGGWGGGCADAGDGRGFRRETRLLARAVAEGWPVTTELRAECLAKLRAALADRRCTPRDAAAITRAIISADGQNVAAMLALLKLDEQTDLAERLDALEQATREAGE